MLDVVKVIMGITGNNLDKYIVIGLMIISMFFLLLLINFLVKTIELIINRD